MSKVTLVDEDMWQLNRERRVREMRRRKMVILKQKIMGAALALIGIACPVLLDGDITATVFLFPVGLYLMLMNTEIR